MPAKADTPKAAAGRGADALVAALRQAGIGRVFTLSGNHVMAVFDAAVGSGLELVHVRHEAAAVHMADALARVGGGGVGVGVALVTGGPGHANALSALYTAKMAEAPLVLLSGHAPLALAGRGAFQEMRQADMAEPVCKASWVCASAGDVAGDLARAIRIARSGRPGPVHLSLPTDVLEASAAAPAFTAEDFAAEPGPLGEDRAGALMQALAAARRPLILAGPALLTRSGRRLLAALQAASGMPVVGMESPRGIADPSLGAFAEVLPRADVVLLLGKRLDFTLALGRAPFPQAATVHQVDADAVEFERSANAVEQRLGLTCQADAASAAQALTAAAIPGAARGWLDEVQTAIAWRPAAWQQARSDRPGHLHPVQMLRPLQALLDSHPDAVLVCDGGEIGQWAAACLTAPHRVINGVAGAIGAGLPYALAARCASPAEAPVVAVMGDGSVGFHLAEFETALRCKLPFLLVVGNDARWNAEYQIQLREYGAARLLGCEMRPTRYDAVAQAFGAFGERVEEAAQMAGALARAQASGLPACLDVCIEGLPAPRLQR